MWDKNIDEVLKQLNTNTNGLNSIEAEKRLKINGKNEIPKEKKNTIWDIFIVQFKSPIILILLIAAIFSVITHSVADCIFILIVISINSIIGTFQEWKSKKSAEKLQNMIKINSRVFRDNKPKEISSENIVVRRCY